MKVALVGNQEEKVGDRQSEKDQKRQQMREMTILFTKDDGQWYVIILEMCLLLFQRLLSLCSCYLSSVSDPMKRKKVHLCILFFYRNTTDGTSPLTG